MVKSIFSTIFKVLCVILVVAVLIGGVYCGVMLYEDKHAHSAVYGSITYHDVYADFSIYDHDFSEAIFYQTQSGFEYKETIPVAVKFDGSANKYNVLLNDLPAMSENSSAGILMSTHLINHYALDGSLTHQTQLDITIKFYQSNIEITMLTHNDKDSQGYFYEYVDFNKLHLSIITAQYIH